MLSYVALKGFKKHNIEERILIENYVSFANFCPALILTFSLFQYLTPYKWTFRTRCMCHSLIISDVVNEATSCGLRLTYESHTQVGTCFFITL